MLYKKGISMTAMTSEVRAMFENVDNVVFLTANEDGQPNGCIVGMKTAIDDETVYLSDQFFKKTLANVQVNQKVSVLFWSGHEAYELYGTARYVNEGEEFEVQKAWVDAAFEKMGMPMRAKGGCFVHIEEVYSSTPGPTAGEKLA